MSRLTKKIFNSVEGYAVNNVPNESDGIYYVNHNVINKLGKLEDLEEELGCPLEVVVKALDDGVCVDVRILDLETTDTIERPRLYYSDDFKCYCFELLFGEYVVKLKDYKKTWWLKGERDVKDKR